MGKEVRPTFPLTEWKVDGKLGSPEKAAFFLEEAFEKPMEMGGGKRECGPKKILDALLNLVGENGWNHGSYPVDFNHVLDL